MSHVNRQNTSNYEMLTSHATKGDLPLNLVFSVFTYGCKYPPSPQLPRSWAVHSEVYFEPNDFIVL